VNGLRRKVHFVGVGGIGMSGLAEILLNLGYEVSGSDTQASGITTRLQRYGLDFKEGHDPSHVGDAGIVVMSAAIPADNVEIVHARERGIPVIHRSDLLADLMRLKPNAVVVGGTHGKTTTTSMISAFLDGANLGATTIVGGILQRSGTNARWGTGDYLVAEADEHDGSFLRLHPTIAVVTNIDAEHLEYYGTIDRIKRAFVDFCNTTPFYGYSILCGDDAHCRDILPEIESVTLTYGLRDDVSLQAVRVQRSGHDGQPSYGHRLADMKTSFEVVCHDARLAPVGTLGSLEVNTIGEHNIQNALGACAVGLCLGIRFPTIADGLRSFGGVRRRMQLCGEEKGVVVIEDYAHHPTEITHTLEASRWMDAKRIICVFQPHLYSRTKFFCDEFAAALALADRTLVTDIYPSREAPMPGVDAGLIVDAAHKLGARHVELVGAMEGIPELLVPDLESGDVVLILGAGNINRIAQPLLSHLKST